jgi:spermidine synthase
VRAVETHGSRELLKGVGIFENDARNHLLTNRKKYDIIASEPSYPTDAGSSNLFTVEFFRLASQRLLRHGVYCQWLPHYLMSDDDLDVMVKTFGLVFPHVFIWEVHGSRDIIMVGSKEALMFTEDEVKKRVKDINHTGYPARFHLLMGPEEVREVAARDDVPVNSDDRPLLEFRLVNNIISARP